MEALIIAIYGFYVSWKEFRLFKENAGMILISKAGPKEIYREESRES